MTVPVEAWPVPSVVQAPLKYRVKSDEKPMLSADRSELLYGRPGQRGPRVFRIGKARWENRAGCGRVDLMGLHDHRPR